MKKLAISKTPWKKQRYPRKLKKEMKKSGRWEFIKKLCNIANFGRIANYKLRDYWGMKTFG